LDFARYVTFKFNSPKDHYVQRVLAQVDSMKFEGKIRGGILNLNLSDEEMSEFLNASDILFKSRKTLKYCYIFAFYGFEIEKSLLKGGIKDQTLYGKKKKRLNQVNNEKISEFNSLTLYQNLFDMNLHILEAGTEKLSKILEDPYKIKAKKVKELTKVCENGNDALFDLIEKKIMKEYENI
jgi:hypothetical protein